MTSMTSETKSFERVILPSKIWTHLHTRSPLPTDIIAMIWDMAVPSYDAKEVETMLQELMKAVQEYRRQNISLGDIVPGGQSFGGTSLLQIMRESRRHNDKLTQIAKKRGL
jgi:hypothetical protein